MKYFIEIEDSLLDFFKKNVDENESVEILVSKMLCLLREILITASNRDEH